MGISEFGLEEEIINSLSEEWENSSASQLDKEYNRAKDDPIYTEILENKLKEINDDVDNTNVDRVISSIKKEFKTSKLIQRNKSLQSILRRGLPITLTVRGNRKSTNVNIIDFSEIENNQFSAVNQYIFEKNGVIKKIDVALFINGMPVVIFELKNSAIGKTVSDAIEDLHEYEKEVPEIFGSNVLNIAATQVDCEYGSLRAPEKHYNPWSSDDQDELVPDVLTQIASLCEPSRIIEFIDDFIIFEESRSGDLSKIIPRHQQYFASRKLVERVLEAIAENSVARGLIWHTQGSGKSFTMLYASRYLIRRNNAQAIILVDGDDLREQMSRTLGRISPDFSYVTAQDMEHLESLIGKGRSEILVTTIQMFQDVSPKSQGNDFTVVMADEAHRFMENLLGNRLEGALPDAHQFGFTGTPISDSNDYRDTFKNYSNGEDDAVLHQYSMKQACEEGVICEVNAESRVGGFQWHLNAEELDQEFEDEFEELSPKERKELLSRRLDAHSLSELPSRADAITNDIANHFLESVDPNGLKGMVVTPSRTAAAMYGQRLQQILQAEEVAVLITDRKNDGDILKQFHTTSKEREKIIDNFKKQGENPKILVVCDMLLTGFDAPILKTIYLDKPLRDHTLMQAIARTNRPRDGKQNGEIIDYRGVVDDIESIFDYSEEDTETYITHDNERFIDEFIDTLDVLKALFDEVDWERRPDSPETVQKWLNCLRTEQERATFQNKWKKLQRLFETISPDKRLVEHEDDYKWIGQLYASFQSSNKGARVSDELQKKTLRLIEENITIEEIERDFPKYTISGREVSNGPLEIKRKETGLQDVLNQGAYFDPRYKQLSERVKEIIEKWNQEVHSDEEALDELRDVEDEVQKIQHERTSKNINKSERAIIGLLETDFSDSIENKKEARNIAESIEINFQKHIDTTVPNWKTNDYTQRQIRNQVRKALITGENRYLSLSSSDEFVEKATKYLIRNH